MAEHEQHVRWAKQLYQYHQRQSRQCDEFGMRLADSLILDGMDQMKTCMPRAQVRVRSAYS